MLYKGAWSPNSLTFSAPLIAATTRQSCLLSRTVTRSVRAVEEAMSTSVVLLTTLLAVTFLHSSSSLPHPTGEEVDQLQELECKPHLALVKVVDYLGKVDGLGDEQYFPKEVAIYRCLPSISFCGNYRLGVSYGTCQPDENGTKQHITEVYYFMGGEKIFQEVEIPEHTACKCPV